MTSLRADQLIVGEPKTARSRRTVDLDAVTVDALRRHRREQVELRLLVGFGWVDTDLVFAGPHGSGLHPDLVSKAFVGAVPDGLRRIQFRDLRHTHATQLLAAGVNPKVVSERLGHASVSFTLDVYGHVMSGQQADAAGAVAALVAGR
jgi:integrase